MIRRVLITGASGFIGSWVLGALARRGVSVAALDQSPDDRLVKLVFGEDVAERIEWFPGSVADPALVDRVVSATRPDSIVHLAALLIPTCDRDPALGASVNVVGHANVFSAATRHAVGHVVYGSSAAASRRDDEGGLMSVYGGFKLWAEEFSRSWNRIEGLGSIGLRPAIVYGRGRRAGETAFATEAIEASLAGKRHVLPCRWQHRLEYIGDVASAFAESALLRDVSSAFLSDITMELTSDAALAAFLNARTEGSVALAPDGAPTRTSPRGDNRVLHALLPTWKPLTFEQGLEAALADYDG